MEDFSYISTASEITPGTSLVIQGDNNSQNTVNGLILQDIVKKAEELESLELQLSHKKSKKKSRQSNTDPENYADILREIGQFVEKLTEVVESADKSLGVPKYTLHCYNMLNNLLIARNKEMKQEIQLNVELLKEQKHENAQLGQELNMFTHLVSEGDEGFVDQDELKSKRQFEETKNDLVDIINMVFKGKDDVKAEFSEFMSQLVVAYVNNLDSSLEDRFIQLPVTCLTNVGLNCLLQAQVVIQHPQHPCSFRLSVD